MRSLFTLLFIFFFGAALAQTTKPQLEIITNKEVIEMHKASLGKSIIISKLQSSICNFDLSTSALIELSKAGVPDEVLKAMLAKGEGKSINTFSEEKPVVAPVTKHSDVAGLKSGMYFLSDGKYIELEYSLLSNTKSGGLREAIASSMSYGLSKTKIRTSLNGSQSATKISSRLPIFIFIFNTSVKTSLGDNTIYSSAAQNPNEFFLVKMTPVNNTREIVIGKSTILDSDIGIDDDAKITFTSKKLKDGIYEVTVQNHLLAGEYCFMFAASSASQSITHRVYDFSIQ